MLIIIIHDVAIIHHITASSQYYNSSLPVGLEGQIYMAYHGLLMRVQPQGRDQFDPFYLDHQVHFCRL